MLRRIASTIYLFATCATAQAAIVSSGNVNPANPAAWTSSTTAYVGESLSGSVTVDGGSLLRSGDSRVGRYIGSAGQVTVNGAGSIWTSSGRLDVGHYGAGTLTITGGGTVSTLNSYVASEFGSTGHVTVDGAGSTWTNGGDLDVGHYGDGTLAISGGGTVSTSSSYVGLASVSTGQITVAGAGSTWTNSDNLHVGVVGAGTLTITGGGTVGSSEGFLGLFSNSTGDVVVDGAGSTWSNSADLHLGVYGDGALTITGGGLVSVGGGLLIGAGGDNFINMATGGILALAGDADDSLAQFLALISGSPAIRYWDDGVSGWADIAGAAYGDDYTLHYLAAGELAGFTLLTVGAANATGLAGDFDGDFDVDGFDFLAWQRGQSPNPRSAADLADWQANFGLVSTSATQFSAAPEPAGAMLAVLAIGIAGLACRGRHRRH
ncbi:MAG: hypothetical protein KDA44_11400 [Planctomycetales bacterium]|nr:hypothetical protein [Planctomycetales bacterium]